MAKDNKVSEAVIRRLPIYHRYLSEIIDKGVERISSSELSKLTGFTASQIRQDLNNFGGFGQQGYGYKAKELKDEIGLILGMNHSYRTIVVGAGRLGQAIAKYSGFRDSGFKIQALFDREESKIGELVGKIPVLSIEDLESYIKDKKIEVAVITVPREEAKLTIDNLIKCGIRGIWNFAPVDVSVPSDVIIENVRFNDSLLSLSYYLKEQNKK